MNETLIALSESPNLGWLVDRLFTRIGRCLRIDRGAVVLARRGGPAHRGAIDGLLGRRSTTGKRLQVDLDQLCRRLHTDADHGGAWAGIP